MSHKKKKLNSERVKELWAMGHSDEWISNQIGCPVYAVQRFRQENGMVKREGLHISYEEIAERMPRVGEQLMKSPGFLKFTENETPKEEPCRVIFVNKKHLHYTVKYRSGMKEGFKLI